MVMAALRWLFKSILVMFYLVPPSELALDDSDPPPQFVLLHGVPMFFVFILVEWAVGFFTKAGLPKPRPTGKTAAAPFYRLNDTVVGILLGSLQQVLVLLLEVAALKVDTATYRFVYDHCRLTEVDPKRHVLLTYVALFAGKDLAYYWAHRTLHEYHLLWSAHSVHHSGEDYNLATALRQGVLQPVCGCRTDLTPY